MKHRTNYPVQGVEATDRERPFYFRPGASPMSVVNSNAAAVTESANFKGHIVPTGKSPTRAQVAPEIAGNRQQRARTQKRGVSADSKKNSQTAKSHKHHPASLTLKINEPAVLHYIRQVSKQTGLTQRHVAADILRSGTAQATRLYPAIGEHSQLK